MKNRQQPNISKSGGVLLMVMLVMLAFSVLAVGLFHMSSTNALETERAEQSKQAFWIAESGLQDAIQTLTYNDVFRDLAAKGSASFNVTNETFGTGYYVTATIDSAASSPIIERYVFDVVSIGWKNNMNRRIQQRVLTQPGFISAIMAPNNITIDANTIVSGPIMVLQNGEIILDDKIPPGQNVEGDYDIVILADDASINGKLSGANEGSDYGLVDLPVPDDVPAMPDYSSYRTTALAVPETSGTITQAVLTVSGDSYFNYPDGLVIEKIEGSGKIINTGNIIIDADTSTGNHVSSDVAILSFGSVSVGKQTEFLGNNLIYAYEQVDIGGGSYIDGNSAILADGGNDGITGDDIIMGGQSEFLGIVFADEGNVIIEPGSGGDKNTRITGTVISGDSVDMNSNSEVIFDPSVFYNDPDLLDLTFFFETSAITTPSLWEELSPL